MAVVIFKKPTDKKPKKEYIDLSVQHRRYKKMHGSYKKAFFVSLAVNLLLFLYIIFIK